jgi:DNA-binding NarL/FixJ family response regulator
MNKEKIKILLVDDHHLFNDGLKGLLINEPNLEVVGQVFDGREAIFAIQKLSPDLVFLDINMPHANGIDLAKEILKNYKEIKIILLTMYEEQQMMKDGKKAGVHGYILKNSTPSELLKGLWAVMDGQYFFDEKIRKRAELPDKDTFAKKYTLTDREIAIIHAVKEGKNSYEIAEELSLSYLTIKTHRRNIHFKLGTSTTPELIKFAVENGI